MYDADDPGTVISVFLITLFIPEIILFVRLWVLFRFSFNELRLSFGLSPIVPASGPGAISARYG